MVQELRVQQAADEDRVLAEIERRSKAAQRKELELQRLRVESEELDVLRKKLAMAQTTFERKKQIEEAEVRCAGGERGERGGGRRKRRERGKEDGTDIPWTPLRTPLRTRLPPPGSSRQVIKVREQEYNAAVHEVEAQLLARELEREAAKEAERQEDMLRAKAVLVEQMEERKQQQLLAKLEYERERAMVDEIQRR